MAMGKGEDVFIFDLGDRVQGKRLQNKRALFLSSS